MTMEWAVQDGTYRLDFDNVVRNAVADIKEGFVVGMGALENIFDIKPSETFGRWTDTETGQVYWDKVEILTDEQQALQAARERQEIAIWDLAHNQEIRVA